MYPVIQQILRGAGRDKEINQVENPTLQKGPKPPFIKLLVEFWWLMLTYWMKQQPGVLRDEQTFMLHLHFPLLQSRNVQVLHDGHEDCGRGINPDFYVSIFIPQRPGLAHVTNYFFP